MEVPSNTLLLTAFHLQLQELVMITVFSCCMKIIGFGYLFDESNFRSLIFQIGSH